MIQAALFAGLIVLAAPAATAQQIMSAPEALAAVESGDMILIDIRSPGEWAETGVAQGAVALTMHNPAFGGQITALLQGQQDKSIGLICATGGRSEYVVSLLAQNGFAGVTDVSEGMIGNQRGPGWIARGLPVVSAQSAQDAYRRLALRP